MLPGMRADRLVQLMLLLQSRPRHTARELAERLEVSERTVLRDLDALSASGVPVVSTRGAHGGFGLVEGWRTSLTGLTRAEVQALAAIGAPGAFDDLGLGAPLQRALVKLSASLPALQRASAEHARQRLLLDPSPWFEGREKVPQLERLREAAWENRHVRIAYRDFEGVRSTRTVSPLALVVKADRWYLVAISERGPSVFRGARIERATLLPTTFERPAGFDLPAFWTDWCRRFGEKRASYPVRLCVTKEGEAALRAMRPPADGARLDAAPVRRGRKELELDFERASIALAQLATLPEGVEVRAPAELRARLAALGEALRRTYRRAERATQVRRR